MATTTTANPTVWARVRAEIERRGWRQYRGSAIDELQTMTPEQWRDGPCCLLQAIGGVVEDNVECTAAVVRVERHLRVGYIGRWNDDPARTVEDVYAVLDALDAEDRAA